MGGILAPWTTRKYRKKAIRLAAARAEAEEKGQAGGEGGRGDGMVWRDGDPTPEKNETGLRKGERYLIKDFSGVVKAGEMMLVVGRPGSGCTTFLKSLAGLHDGYAGVDGQIKYGTMGKKELKPYRNEVIFVSEEDTFYPDLKVGPTLDFALRNNTPAERAMIPREQGAEPMKPEEWQEKTKGELLKMLGLEHTADTKVGDQYTRGVSGE